MIINSFSSLFPCPRGPAGSSSGSTIHHVAHACLTAGSRGPKRLRLLGASPSPCRAVAVVKLASPRPRFPRGSFALQHFHPASGLAALNCLKYFWWLPIARLFFDAYVLYLERVRVGVQRFGDSLTGVKVEPPNQLLPERGHALPWRRALSTPCPAPVPSRGAGVGGTACLGWGGGRPAGGGCVGTLAHWFSCARVLWLTPSRRHVLPDSVTRPLFLETVF